MVEFILIACMRVVQTVCNKKASIVVVKKREVFLYGAFYQISAAVLSFVYLCFRGFQGLDFETFLCAFVTAVFLAFSLITELEAIKGAPIAVCTVCSMGGLFVPCIVGIFLFNEVMRSLQWFALVVFLVGIYFLGSTKEKMNKISTKTIFLLLLNFFTNGMVMVSQKYFAMRVSNGDASMFSFFMFLSSAIIFIGCLIYQIFKEKNRKSVRLPGSVYGYGFALSVAVFVVNYIMTVLAGKMNSVTLYTISSFITIGISAVIGAIGFHEKITVRKMLGLCMGTIAIIMAN